MRQRCVVIQVAGGAGCGGVVARADHWVGRMVADDVDVVEAGADNPCVIAPSQCRAAPYPTFPRTSSQGCSRQLEAGVAGPARLHLPLEAAPIYIPINPMPAYHKHRWQVRREWWDADGRLLRQRTCEGCKLEQQLHFVVSDMTWTLFRQSDLRTGPFLSRNSRRLARVIS